VKSGELLARVGPKRETVGRGSTVIGSSKTPENWSELRNSTATSYEFRYELGRLTLFFNITSQAPN